MKRFCSPVVPSLFLPLAASTLGCDIGAQTTVFLDNDYPASASVPLVVYRAEWQAVSFPDPVPPGSSSGPEPTEPASPNTAYAILAPGWDPRSSEPPTSFIVLRSRTGFAVPFEGALHIHVDDTTFDGNCASGSPLSQKEADFITDFVFPRNFVSLRYDAASCTTTGLTR